MNNIVQKPARTKQTTFSVHLERMCVCVCVYMIMFAGFFLNNWQKLIQWLSVGHFDGIRV